MTSSPPLQKNRGYLAGIPSKFLHSLLFLYQLQLISPSTWPHHFPLLSQEEVSYLPFRAPLPPVFSNSTSPHPQTPSPAIILSLSLTRLLLLPTLFFSSGPSSWSWPHWQCPLPGPVSALNISYTSAAAWWPWPCYHKGHSNETAKSNGHFVLHLWCM